MVRTIYLLIAYDGTDFHGWQSQGELRTVQGILEQSIRRVARHPIGLAGSGRTDAGVHAAGQAASFVTECPLPAEKLAHAIGSRLPKDVSVITAREVHPDFHATQSAVSKLYRYRIHNAPGRPVEQGMQRYVYHHWQPLDVEAMGRAARYLLGEKDFAAFAASGNATRTTVRTIFRCDVERHLEEIRIDVEGSGFLYNQVRIMAGTLVQVGKGRWQPEEVAEVAEGRDRARAGPTLPARGLCLRWVRYPAHLLRPPSGERNEV